MDIDYHFSRKFKGDSREVSMARHKHYLFLQMGLRPGMRILEVGCGMGSAALELAAFEDVFVVGVDPDAQNIIKAEKACNKRGLTGRVSFITGELASLSSIFDDSSFDGIYSIESLRHLSSFDAISGTLSRLLKPGGKLAIYEWCWTSSVDATNKDHQRLSYLLEDATGIGSLSIRNRSISTIYQVLQSEDLDILNFGDLSETTSKISLPWYTDLDKALSYSRTRWADEVSRQGEFGDLTRVAAQIISQAGHLKLFTPMAFFIARKRTV